MKEEIRHISVKQIIILFLIIIASPMIRLIPKNAALIAKQGSIIMPFISIIPFILLIYILNQLINKSKEKTLQDVYIKIFGKLIGKTILIIYIIWIFVLVSIYVRYFAERFTASILTFTPISFFVITMLTVIFIVTRNKLEYLARVIEVFFLFFSMLLILLFFIALPDVEIDNIYPITINDVWDATKAVPAVLAVLSYITYTFFLGDEIKNKEKFLKYKSFMIIKILFIQILVVLTTVGIFGYKLSGSFNLPFFIFLKNIEILDVVERFEAIFISVWFVTDFALISMFIFVIIKLFKRTFHLKNSKAVSNPIIAGTVVFSLYLASDVFELQKFTDEILVNGNIVIGIVIPLLAFIVGKIRRII